MQTSVVLTLTGPDRVGIVDDLTGALLELGANVEASRMARLGGEFAVLVLASVSTAQHDRLDDALEVFRSAGYKMTVTETVSEPGMAIPDAVPFRIEVVGADHEGIIHQVSHRLSEHGINIESLETFTSPAPVSGTPLFSMVALVAVPASLSQADWGGALADAGREAGVDVSISRVEDHPSAG